MVRRPLAVVMVVPVVAVVFSTGSCGGDEQTATEPQIKPVPRSRTEAQIEATVRRFEGERSAAGYRAFTDCIRSMGVQIRYRPGVRELLRPDSLRKKSARRRDDTFRYFLFDFEKPHDKAEAARFEDAQRECIQRIVRPAAGLPQ
jgi:hypothetical protein